MQVTIKCIAPQCTLLHRFMCIACTANYFEYTYTVYYHAPTFYHIIWRLQLWCSALEQVVPVQYFLLLRDIDGIGCLNKSYFNRQKVSSCKHLLIFQNNRFLVRGPVYLFVGNSTKIGGEWDNHLLSEWSYLTSTVWVVWSYDRIYKHPDWGAVTQTSIVF